MKHEVKKITKIIDEILTFCVYNMDPRRSEMVLEKTDNAFTVVHTFYDVSISAEELAEIRRQLGTKRNHELEDYYWQLTGEIENSSELDLVGMMSDEAVVEYENEKLIISLIRKL